MLFLGTHMVSPSGPSARGPGADELVQEDSVYIKRIVYPTHASFSGFPVDLLS